MPPNSEKRQLVKRTLEFWSSEKVLIDHSLRKTSETRLQPAETVTRSTEMKVEVGFDPLALGQQFVYWIFQLLNSQNPSLGQPPQDWGPQHQM
ncbi:uncharacterized protein C3orf38 homolog [Diretmus argenteus]